MQCRGDNDNILKAADHGAHSPHALRDATVLQRKSTTIVRGQQPPNHIALVSIPLPTVVKAMFEGGEVELQEGR